MVKKNSGFVRKFGQNFIASSLFDWAFLRRGRALQAFWGVFSLIKVKYFVRMVKNSCSVRKLGQNFTESSLQFETFTL